MPARLAHSGLLILALAAPPCLAGDTAFLVQRSPLAGAQYHALDGVLPQIRAGDGLGLVREPDNPHDSMAVRVEWQGHKLGYIPKAQNRTLALAMDSGEAIQARVGAVTPDPNPWKRLRIDVWVASPDTRQAGDSQPPEDR